MYIMRCVPIAGARAQHKSGTSCGYGFAKGPDNPYQIKTDKGGEDISWLLG